MKCEICGKSYERLAHLSGHVKRVHNIDFKTYYDRYLKVEGEGECETCGAPTTFSKGKYASFCSNKCINAHEGVKQKMSASIKKTLSEKTDSEWEDINKKRVETVLKRHGVENISQKEEIRQSRSENTFLATEENREILKSLDWESIQEKRTKTNLKRYGHITPAKSKPVRDKISSTKRKDFFKKMDLFEKVATPLFNIEEYEGGKSKPYPWKCSVCGDVFEAYIDSGKLPRCLSCYPKIKSNLESDVVTFLEQHGVKVKKNDRTLINPLEIDILLEDFNIGIEINGLYWHSESSGGKDSKYHLNKLKCCEEKGIKLIHIFEDELITHRDIVFSKLLNFISKSEKKIYARKCEVREIDKKQKKSFLECNHLQGDDRSSVCLGAFFNGELVSVMTFSKGRVCLNTKGEDKWELSRFCSSINHSVVGIASKLLKYFEKQYSPNSLTTYADRRWSSGGLYYNLGFNMSHESRPSYWYFKYGYYERHHRFNFRKNILHKKLESFDEQLTEWENMQLNGYDRIWDCGTFVFKKHYPTKNIGGGVSANPYPV